MTDASRLHPSRWFWVGLAAGGALVVVGTRGLLHDHTATQPSDLVKWLVGAGVVHDAVIAPFVVLAAWLTGRVVPASARVAVRLALASSVLLAVITWPLVQGWGRRTTNPSALPLDYGRNVLLTLAVIWVVAITLTALRIHRARR